LSQGAEQRPRGAVLVTILRELSIDELLVSEHDVLDGLAASLRPKLGAAAQGAFGSQRADASSHVHSVG
jgi:hypothetical protein